MLPVLDFCLWHLILTFKRDSKILSLWRCNLFTYTNAEKSCLVQISIATHRTTFMRYISTLALNKKSRIPYRCLKTDNDLIAWSLFRTRQAPPARSNAVSLAMSHVDCLDPEQARSVLWKMSFDLMNLIRSPKKNLGCILMCRKKQLFSFYSLYCLKIRQVLFYLIHHFGLKNVYLLSYNLHILSPVLRPFCVIKLHEDGQPHWTSGEQILMSGTWMF